MYKRCTYQDVCVCGMYYIWEISHARLIIDPGTFPRERLIYFFFDNRHRDTNNTNNNTNNI